MKPELIFAHFSSISALLPLLIGTVKWKHIEKELRPVLWISIVSVVSDGVSFGLFKLRINNWPISNFYVILQLLLFYLLLIRNKKSGTGWIFYGILFLSLLNYTFIQGPRTFNSYTAYAGGLIMIFLAINYLYRLLVEMPVEKIQVLSKFWIAFGALIYFGGTLFLFLFNNYMISHQPENHRTIWILQLVLNITKNGFLFIAIWMSYKGRTYPS